MNKKQSIFILGVVLILLLAGGIWIFKSKFNDNKKDTENTKIVNNKQSVSIEKQEISETVVETISLKNGAITKIDNIYHITMTAINNTNQDVDLSLYRISFRNKDNAEIEWFNGSAIGVVKANETKEFIIDSYADLSELNNIEYTKMG